MVRHAAADDTPSYDDDAGTIRQVDHSGSFLGTTRLNRRSTLTATSSLAAYLARSAAGGLARDG
jgi:hypothetical protein